LSRFGFSAEVEGFRGADLHFGGEFVGGDPGFEAGVSGMRIEVVAIEGLEEFETGGFSGCGDLRGGGRGFEIGDGDRIVGADDDSLMGGGKEGGGEIAGVVVGESTRVGEDDESGEIVAEVAEGIGDPGTDGGKAGSDETGVLHVAGGAVDIGLAGHRHEKGEVIDAFGGVRKDARHPATGLAVLFELEGGLHHVADGTGDGDLDTEIDFFAVAFGKFGFVVEGIHLAGAAVHEELNDPFDFGGMMQTAVEFGFGEVGTEAIVCKKLGEGDAAESACGFREETTSIERAQ